MISEERLDAMLQSLHREPATQPQTEAVVQRVLTTEIEAMPQGRGPLPKIPEWRFGSILGVTRLVAASVIVALFGGLLLGGLAMRPSGEEASAIGASASATALSESTDAIVEKSEPPTAPEAVATMATPELLPDVSLVTEQVEPGVFRVLSDGVREPARVADDDDAYLNGILESNIAAGSDGSVWWFGPESFFRLGDAVDARLVRANGLGSAYRERGCRGRA